MGTILRHKYVTTRTPHICFGCGRNILSPARMASVAYADGGTAEFYYLCKTCDTIVSRMFCLSRDRVENKRKPYEVLYVLRCKDGERR